ncbi:hypothetical protein OIE66_37095 [Nonomuraea sp. NBC_01738]|uniref:hypothetical protein n=1 Tax=Nonomuraea sp. NBC_01738 TaxID=2976003 RepID=UPI002E115B19|nr:hypothetical protein OIE66_37095 [Nonomuraea sp. NBC_01738]
MSATRVAAVVVAMLAGAVACGGAADTTPPEEITPADELVLSRAEALLVRDCMRAEGFEYWVRPPGDQDGLLPVGFVLDDVEWARRNGYGTEARNAAVEARKTSQNARYVNGLPAARRTAYDLALSGGPGNEVLSVKLPDGRTINNSLGGCSASGIERLYGDRATWFRLDRLAMNITPMVMRHLVKDARYTAGVTGWSACMRERGHDFAAPPEAHMAVAGLVAGMEPERARATEVKLAVDEATCARKTGLRATMRTLGREYRPRIGARYVADLDAYDRLRSAALRRAREIIRTQR